MSLPEDNGNGQAGVHQDAAHGMEPGPPGFAPPNKRPAQNPNGLHGLLRTGEFPRVAQDEDGSIDCCEPLLRGSAEGSAIAQCRYPSDSTSTGTRFSTPIRLPLPASEASLRLF